MAISRKTYSDFIVDLEGSILSRNANYDVKIGPVPDLVINPLAGVLELQNERIRSVQQLLALINDGSFTDADLDDFVFNELLIRLSGSRATATLVFSRTTAPTSDITVRANFPVGTLPDEDTGAAVTFLTTVDATMVAAQAPAYFNSTTQRYELSVSAQAVAATSLSNVASNRINRPLRPLNGFDSVTNREAATSGKDTETKAELIERYYLSLIGSSPTVVNGIHKIVRDNFAQVIDANVVYGNNPLNIRSSADGGAVDVYIIGEAPASVTENIVFSGVEQTIILNAQPIISITSAGAFIQGTDFVLVKDTSGYKESVRASDGIKWLSTGTAPAVGDVVTITYVYDTLVQTLQDGFTTDDRAEPGRDILFKKADQIDITMSANIKIRPGFSVTTVIDNVTTVLLEFFNNVELGDDIELSDIQALVRSFSSVDNFIITNISKVGDTGTVDIPIGDNEYARMEEADLLLSVI